MSQTAASTTASQPGSTLIPDTTHLFTTANFVLMAVLAVLVVIGLIYGARLHRGRREARDQLVEHNEALRDEGVVEAPVAPTGELAAPPAPPVAPSPTPSPPAVPIAPVADLREPTPLDDEPIAAATPDRGEHLAAEAAAPAPPAPAPAPSGPSPADGPVTLLKGLGPRVAERLREQGITTVGQIAALTDDEAAALDARLGPFTGRMTRDRWLEQSRFLAAGDLAGFESVFGRL